jgi:hypothetical protein
MTLPFIDEQAIRIPAPRDVVWPALERYVERALAGGDRRILGRLLGTDPPSGFAVAQREPGVRIVLEGRHRFSRYELAFELAEARDGATLLRAQTSAAFPGLHGRTYRALVIGTRAHVLVTNSMLRAVRRLAVSARPA